MEELVQDFQQRAKAHRITAEKLQRQGSIRSAQVEKRLADDYDQYSEILQEAGLFDGGIRLMVLQQMVEKNARGATMREINVLRSVVQEVTAYAKKFQEEEEEEAG